MSGGNDVALCWTCGLLLGSLFLMARWRYGWLGACAYMLVVSVGWLLTLALLHALGAL